MFPFVMASEQPLTALAYHDECHDTGLSTGTLALPTIQAGDLIIVCERRNFSSAQDQTDAPTGYTKLKGVFNSGRTACYSFSYRILDGTETVVPIYSGTDFTGTRRLCFIYRPTGVIEDVNIFDEADVRTDANPTAQVVSASASAAITIVIGQYGSDGSGNQIDPRTFTGATPDAELSGAQYNYAKAAVQEPTASDVTVDMDDEGNGNQLISFYLEIT